MKVEIMHSYPFIPRRRTGAALLLSLGLIATAGAEPVGKGGVTVRKWADGLGGPQGLVRGADGSILVVEHDAGKVSRYSQGGMKLGTLAEGLKSPSWALLHDGALFVAERKGNSVARITPGGEVVRLEGEVVDPLGIISDPKQPRAFLVVSHRQSQVRRFVWDGGAKRFSLQSEAVVVPAGGAKYGWRDLAAAPDGTLFFTDEVAHAVLRRKPGGEVESWATGLASPSGLAYSPGGELYVSEEGGRVSRLAADGTPTVLAEGLGAAREILFLDARNLLVSDRKGGAVWKVTLPAGKP